MLNQFNKKYIFLQVLCTAIIGYGNLSLAQTGSQKPLRKLSPDRPHQTESPITVDKGHIMIEADLINVTREKKASDTKHTMGLGAFNLKFGFHKRMDIEVISGTFLKDFYRYKSLPTSQSFLPDLTFRYKINLCGNDSGDVAIALMPLLHTNNFFKDKFQILNAGMLLNLETEIFGKLGLGYTGGFSSFSVDPLLSEYELFSTMSLDYKVVGALRNFAEVSYRYNPSANSLHTFSFDSGLTFTPTSNLQFDTGFYLFLPNLKPFVFLGGTIRI